MRLMNNQTKCTKVHVTAITVCGQHLLMTRNPQNIFLTTLKRRHLQFAESVVQGFHYFLTKGKTMMRRGRKAKIIANMSDKYLVSFGTNAKQLSAD